MRLIPETANRQDWPRLVAQEVNALRRDVTTLQAVPDTPTDPTEPTEWYHPMERDADGNPFPIWREHTFTYDTSGNLKTDTVTDGTDTWVKTYTYTEGQVVAESGWVKQ